ncbi:hypothetical protein BDF19DRAFT_419079 [Syncephalis fuscata]|nr:hypothetical protein BDF19DRAFT_419079 [Syncephalis fuscata]
MFFSLKAFIPLLAIVGAAMGQTLNTKTTNFTESESLDISKSCQKALNGADVSSNVPIDGADGHRCTDRQINKVLDALESSCTDELANDQMEIQKIYTAWLIYPLIRDNACRETNECPKAEKLTNVFNAEKLVDNSKAEKCEYCERAFAKAILKWKPTRPISIPPLKELINKEIEKNKELVEKCNITAEQEKSASAHNTDNVQNDYQHNSNWLRHCIAQFDLAKNWQHGIDACNMLNISENSSIEDNTQTASRILASNVWGTLILTEANILYFAAHWPKPKLTFIANVSGSFSDQSYNLIKGVLNKRFIVLAGPGRPANNSGVANGCVLYWDQTQPRPIESKQLLYNHGATEIVDLRDQWLLLKKPTVSTESYSINILNLQQRVPIPVKSEAHWNTYSIFGTSNTTCKVYAGALNTNTQHQFASHSWDMLQSGVLDLRTVDEQRK